MAAAQVRNDDVFARLNTLEQSPSSESGEMRYRYHRKCYQTYTSKSHLSHCRQANESDTPGITPVSPETSTGLPHQIRPTRSQTPITDWSVCIICLRKQYKKDRTLHKIQTKAAEKSLREAAASRQDNDMLRRMGTDDLIAVDAVYHLPCLVAYTRKKSIQKTSSMADETESGSVHDQAFQQLKTYVEDEVLRHGKAVLLTSLLDLYKS